MLRVLAVVAGLALGLGGCAQLGGRCGAVKVGQVFVGGSGTRISWEELGRRLRQADVVIVAESHSNPCHHWVQQRVLRLVARGRAPKKVVVGLEWVGADSQRWCDELSAGRIGVAEFARKVRWGRTWGYDFKLYRGLVKLMRGKGWKVVGLSPPWKVVKAVARGGLRALTPAQRACLAPAMELSDKAYQRLVGPRLAMHRAMGLGKALKRMFLAQMVRDETMAWHLAEAMGPWPDGGKVAVVFVGSGHLPHGQGLPRRILRRLPGAKILTVVPVDLQEACAAAVGGAGQFVVACRPSPPRLGAWTTPVEGGLKVLGVIPHSPAARAGIRKGDVILAVDGRKISSAKDIHRAIRTRPFAPHHYKVRRNGRVIELEISLGRQSQAEH